MDANVLFSAAYRPDNSLLKLWSFKVVVLCTSRYALEEARRNLELDVQRAQLSELSCRLELFDAAVQVPPRNIHLPTKDVPILLAAIEAGASHLLTGDLKHFGSYFGQRIAGVLIIAPSDYFRERGNRRNTG